MQQVDIFNLEQYKYDNLILLSYVLAVIIGLIIITAFLINVYFPFRERRDYIKMEMSRCKGKEYTYWKNQLKYLYISHIPIIRLFIRRKHR